MTTFRYIGLPALLARGQAALRVATKVAAEDLADRVRDEIPKGPTGALHDSVEVDGPHVSTTSVEAKVKAGGGEVWYAAIVHEGAGAHAIRPVEGALQIGGEFAAVAEHPGFTGYKFVERPLLEHRARYLAALRAASRKAF